MDSQEENNKPNHTSKSDPAVAATPRWHGNSAQGQRGPTVLMLGGFGRSGSTLLERCLAQCEGIVGLGEVLHLWERGLRDNELCGCGVPFHECPVWSAIGQQAFGGWQNVAPEQIIEDRWAVVRNRYLPWLALGKATGWRRESLSRFTDRLDHLYQGAQQVTGARVLVDSSKHPAYAYLLRAAKVDLRCVLVVRDPRGVAFSWSKVVKRPETGSLAKDMPRYSIPASIGNWTTYSLMFHALSLLRVPVLTVHYEDFMTAPVATLQRIVEFSGICSEGPILPEFHGNSLVLKAHHTVAGNPMRFKVGSVRLKLDAAWEIQMPPRDKTLASILSFPLRVGYRFTKR